MLTVEECVDYLVSRGIPEDEAYDSAMEFLDLASRVERGEDVSPPQSSFYVTNFDASERYVLGPVLVPNHVDTWGTFFPPTTVKNAAHKFMSDYQLNKFMHTVDVGKQDIQIVESYLAPVDMVINGDVIRKGTWMMGIIVHNDAIWEHIKRGDIRGFSIGAHVTGGALSLRKNDTE